MTILQAFQAMLEYENDNLLTKALVDRGCTSSSATYTASDQATVELAAADVYLSLIAHPDFREGSRFINYSKGALLSLQRELLRKHGQLPATVTAPVDSAYQKTW